MARIGYLIAWVEICVANRLAALGMRSTKWGEKWADAATQRYGHFYAKLRGES